MDAEARLESADLAAGMNSHRNSMPSNERSAEFPEDVGDLLALDGLLQSDDWANASTVFDASSYVETFSSFNVVLRLRPTSDQELLDAGCPRGGSRDEPTQFTRAYESSKCRLVSAYTSG